jgi:arylsulfatase A-like enzyme
VAHRPNIVIIMTDDQTANSMRVMPRTRALIGRQGTTFSNSFVTLPWCCPSRASFFTGQYPHNHGVWNAQPPTGGYVMLDNDNTLPVWLQEAGYFTSHIGKYLNGYGLDDPKEVPPGWDHWQGLVDPSTYLMYGYTINDNGTLVRYGEDADDYQTDVIADRAVRTIGEGARKGPFFLSIAPVAPHAEGIKDVPGPRAAPRHKGAFADTSLPKPPSFNEADVSDKPAPVRNLPLLNQAAVAEIRARYRDRLASLLAVDELVERVVDKLRSSGLLHETVLIFTSDNGYFQGEHRIPWEKGPVYEEGVRVPLLIRGRGFPAGAKVSQLAANIDLAPTIVELTGATAGLVMDGRSLLPLAPDAAVGRHRGLLIEKLDYQAVRNDSFLYVEYAARKGLYGQTLDFLRGLFGQGHANPEQELYDLRPGSRNYDPFQLQSRHADPAYARIKIKLAAKLDQLRACSGAACR